MKRIIYIVGVLLMILSSCSSPSSDAKKVCECMSSLNSDSDGNDDSATKIKKFGNKLVDKCVKMQTEFTTKYADNTENLKEFNLEVTKCMTE